MGTAALEEKGARASLRALEGTGISTVEAVSFNTALTEHLLGPRGLAGCLCATPRVLTLKLYGKYHNPRFIAKETGFRKLNNFLRASRLKRNRHGIHTWLTMLTAIATLDTVNIQDSVSSENVRLRTVGVNRVGRKPRARHRLKQVHGHSS